MRKPSHREKNCSNPHWPISYRWLAIGTLITYTAVGSKITKAAWTDEGMKPPDAADSSRRKVSLPVRRFDITAGLLDSVLEAYQQTTGLVVSLSNAGLGSLKSPGVAGVYTAETALQKILDGTGLAYKFDSPEHVTVRLQQVNTEVTVNGSTEQVTSPKYAEPIRDTPQTISVVPLQVMQQQNTTTLRDVLRNVAGISLAAGEGGAQGDNLTIRGFTARNDLYIDGMRDFGSYYRDPFDVQEVEVLQGPSSITFGRGSTGGVVNQETKTPAPNRTISAGLDFGTDLTRRLTLDINTPVPLLGENSAFRLNVMGDANDVAGRDVAKNRRFGVAPALAFGLGTSTRGNLQYFHQTGDDIPDYGIPWYFNGPSPVNRANYYGFANGNYLRTYDDLGTVRVEHDFNSHVTLRNQARYANYVRDVLITEPQIPSGTALSKPLSDIQITRHEIGVNSDETFLDDQLDLTANFKTGWVQHTLISGFELSRETSDPTRPTYSNVPTTSLLNPDPYQQLSGTVAITSKVNTVANSVAAYVIDTLKFGRKWELTGGLRWDRFAANYHQYIAPVSAFARVDDMPSWRAAIVYKPVTTGTIYVSAGTSFNPSAETLALSAGTANLAPEKNRTVEAGTKWDVLASRLAVRGAVFQTAKTNAREASPVNSLLYVLAGNQRVNGVEAEIRGRVTSRWELLSSYARLDSKVVSSKYYPGAIGYPLANVPANTFNLWTEYHLPRHYEVGGGSNYVSSRTASSTVPLDATTGLLKNVPGYWVFNVMGSHPLNEHAEIHANIYNLANRYYYDEIHPGHIVLGAGRSALIGIRFKF